MGKPVFLLGAGASIDAGLTDTYRLTQLVYDRLREGPTTADQRLFGYVISKLIARNVRAGGSPFDAINIEDAYDGIVRLIERDKDLLSDFVYSWDPILDQIRPRFDETRFVEAMANAIREEASKKTGSVMSILGLGNWSLKEVASSISTAFAPDLATANLESFLDPFLETLTSCLVHNMNKLSYMRDLVSYSARAGGLLATLNYDLVIESALEQESLSFDYGLSAWNSRKVIRWVGADTKLIKLHGSVNWFGGLDNVTVGKEGELKQRKHVMIFGALRGKLTPEGPFLPLRHELERELRQTNVLAVIGYSFRDAHLNALIRRWVSTRRNAKLIIADPSELRLGTDVIGYPWISDNRGNITKYTVEVVPINKTAKDGMEAILDACDRPPDPEAAYRKAA